MLGSLDQLAGDPVLRRWVLFKLMRGQAPRRLARQSTPPYIDRLPEAETSVPQRTFPAFSRTVPVSPVTLDLAGHDFTVNPGEEHSVFDQTFEDVEILLALHRFGWSRFVDDPAWVGALWTAWMAQYGEMPDDGWPWHPYTAAERAIAILSFGRRFGLPGPVDETLQCLARHGDRIAVRLEYFGEGRTSNHLSNNGRGLLYLGVELGLESYARLGIKIMLEEAKRLFKPSGVLREGSSHYHILVANRYSEAAEMAGRAGMPGADELRMIAAQAQGVSKRLCLPGGLPLIGDVSPDLTPDLTFSDSAHYYQDVDPVDQQHLSDDGWLSFSNGPWQGLWYVSPDGWQPAAGHGHQDFGGFELHYEGRPVFVDIGRGSYREGRDHWATTGAAHNSIQIDGESPYPTAKPYYDDKFKHTVAGQPPALNRGPDWVELRYNGFRRLPGVGNAVRRWQFSRDAVSIADKIDGHGSRQVVRQLHTPGKATITSSGVILDLIDTKLFIRTDKAAEVTVGQGQRWRAYGRPEDGNIVTVSAQVRLPWQGEIRVSIWGDKD